MSRYDVDWHEGKKYLTDTKTNKSVLIYTFRAGIGWNLTEKLEERIIHWARTASTYALHKDMTGADWKFKIVDWKKGKSQIFNHFVYHVRAWNEHNIVELAVEVSFENLIHQLPEME